MHFLLRLMVLKNYNYFIGFLLAFILASGGMQAQNTVIKGRVIDAASGEPMPYTNVYVEGKFIGTMTDDNGYYELHVNKRADTLAASALGYKILKKPIAASAEQTLNFELEIDAISLDMAVVMSGENPADVLLRRVIANKRYLNPAQFNTLQYEAYTKYQIDLADFAPKNIDESKLLSRFPHLKDYVDTISGSGTSTLPIFFIENMSDNYTQNSPSKATEHVKAVKMSGVQKQDFITTLLGGVNQNLNIYENLMAVMGKNFVSPAADYALGVYKYTLHVYDTLYINGEPHLEMSFKPKRKGENTFTGKMLVNIKSFAIRSIEMELSEDVNIGFIEKLWFYNDFEPYPYNIDGDSGVYWMPNREQLKIQFTYYIGGETKIIGRKTKSYKKLKINQPIPDDAWSAFDATDIDEEAYEHTEEYWDTVRHVQLGETEAGIYDMVDSLKRTKRFKTIFFAAQTLTSGYARVAKVIEFGPVANAFSINKVEGFRLRMGVRTTPKFSERVQLETYIAYGFKDERVKYGGKVQFIISRKPWNKLALSAFTDVDLKSRNAEEIDYDNVFSILQKKNVIQRLYNIESYKLVYDTELHKDLTAYFTLLHRRFKPAFDFAYEKENILRTDLRSSEASISLRWQYKSKPLPGTFLREAQMARFFGQFRKKNEWPIVRLMYTAGIPNFPDSDFKYHDVAFGLQGDVQVTAKMSFYYNAWVGKIIGTVPYLLLRNPEGNISYVHNKYLFNNMSLLEFSADQYTSLNFQWYFGGMLFDKIPWIKTLKLREVVTTNVFYGNMTSANKAYNRLNAFDVAYPIPYVEAGVGIENIFKFIRIDYIQRFTHLDKPNITKWAIYASLFIKI
ncbi:DUF5686 family protein [soil metagenome]